MPLLHPKIETMKAKQIPKLIRKELSQVEAEIQKRLKIDNPLIAQVSRHICNSGGKRLRPMLLLLSSRLCDYREGKDILYATVIEFIHVATLLHDDVIDGSETRRGTHSANARWGNHVPVLAGDYLYSMSNVMLAEAGIPSILALVSLAIMDLSEGEILEEIKKGDPGISEAEYMDIIRKKTAALFSACCQIGAVLGQKGKEREDALVSYGLNMGIAFQMMDDVLDFVANEKKLGKPLGNDLREGNLTIPIIRLLQKAGPAEQERIKQIVQAPQGSEEELNFVLRLLEEHQIISVVIKDARSYAAKAKQELQLFDDSVYREALLAVADYAVEREY